MNTTPRYRETARQQLRHAIIDAARELTVDRGWDAVRMADVATQVGVSRQTVYNEFASKAGLGEALAQREIDGFVAGVRAALFAHGSDAHAAVHAAVTFVLSEAATDPLVKAVLTSARGGADALLPYLTTRSDFALAAATAALYEWAEAHLPDLSPADMAVGAESIVRLVVSHIVLPLAPVEQTAAALADLAVRFLDGPPGPSTARTAQRR
jgi:AcrR family transcriptional regulator